MNIVIIFCLNKGGACHEVERFIAESSLANKIGTAESMIGDMGLLYFPDRPPIALTIMIEDPQDTNKAEEEIGQLTKIIVDSIVQ